MALFCSHDRSAFHCQSGRGRPADLAAEGPPAELAALRDKFPISALAMLALRDAPWRTLEPGTARLVSFVRPRDLGVT